MYTPLAQDLVSLSVCLYSFKIQTDNLIISVNVQGIVEPLRHNPLNSVEQPFRNTN